MKARIALVLIGLVATNPTKCLNAQEGLTLTVGRLNYSDKYIQQNISITNGSSKAVRSVRVECGFFSKGELIATDSAIIENIAPNTTGFGTITERSDVSPDRAECRIASVR